MEPFDETLTKVLGARTAKALASGLSLATVGDLLGHYPRRYAERGELTDLAGLAIGEHVTVMAKVETVTKRRMQQRRGTILEAVVTDGTGRLSLTFFNQPWRERDLRVGRVGLFSGKVGSYRGARQLANPDYQLMADDSADDLSAVDAEAGSIPATYEARDAVADFAGAIVPVYPATSSLPTWKIAQCIQVVLDTLEDVEDPLPIDLRAKRGLVGLREAIVGIHRPANRGEIDRAQERLRFDEAFRLQCVLALRRADRSARPAVPRDGSTHGILAAFDQRIPFALTQGQREIGDVIAADLASAHPMHRLLQGEVGSGKTVVALRAMLTVVDSGGQAALLAPTEVLAQQHHRSLTTLLGPLADAGFLGGAEVSTRVALLTGSTSAAGRRAALLEAISGDAGIVVGTHALLEDVVQFRDLGLVVIDEQHRFGVEQRAALSERSDQAPHVLVMTATPIPRTVAMTVFGDLETSVLSELPVGRSPITTHVVPALERPRHVVRAWERVREEVAAGHQAYVVCPRIGDDVHETGAELGDEEPGAALPADGDGDSPQARRPSIAVLDLLPILKEGPLAGLRVLPLHGRMRADGKDATMRAFAAGDVDVLVATTVIEVGVDVPNATTMVVMDADRFGVSQLHQLRGRVGRGEAAGLCLLVTDAPELSPARARLEAVASTTDGFALSRLDLEQRKEGNVLGVDQSGRRSSLRLLSVLRDEDVIVAARDDAFALIRDDPELDEHPALRRIIERVTSDDSADFLAKN